MLSADAEEAKAAALEMIWRDLAAQRPTDNLQVAELIECTAMMAVWSLAWSAVIRERGADQALIDRTRAYTSRLQRGLILLGAVRTRFTLAAAALTASLEIVEAAEALMPPPAGGSA